MDATALCRLTIGQLAELIRNRDVSPLEATEAALARAKALNGSYNAFIAIWQNAVLQAAREAAHNNPSQLFRSGRFEGVTPGILATSASPILNHLSRPQQAVPRLAAHCCGTQPLLARDTGKPQGVLGGCASEGTALKRFLQFLSPTLRR